MRELTKQCKKDKICHRRSNNALEDLGPEDLESDYFGHTVPKVRKVTNSVTDRVDQLLELEEKSLGTPYEKLPKLSVHQDKFTKLNDWLRYLANGGMARNKLRVNKIDHNDDDFYELTRSESFSSTPMKKSRTKRMRFTPYTGPTFETDDGSMGIDRDMEQMKISKKPKVPWGVRGSDYEFKKKARDAYRERQRAGFDPKREGIDIELPYEY
ncbi:hypothetical protein O0L34_g4531 [Tuta absoluta]|nr:hypothetical protein O0L34_g4531 [Tuta absoluta]